MKKAPKKVLFLTLIQLRQNILPMDEKPSRGGESLRCQTPPKRLELRPEQ